MYVTLEPCPMCAGAIIQSRLPTLVYGARNLVYGSFGTIIAMQDYFPDARNIEIIPGVLEAEASALMKSFFARRRKDDK